MTFTNRIAARCSATIREDVKAGRIKPCADDSCIVGSIAGVLVAQKDWEKAVTEFGNSVVEFNTSRKALPHPGHIIRMNYCTACGTYVEKFHENRENFTNEMWDRITNNVKG